MSVADCPKLRRAIKVLRIKVLRASRAALWTELRRLNSLGQLRGSAGAGRAKRSAEFRAALSEKYRDRSACC